ncbi:beta-lactamase family protein [Myxococcota bacterium]|nr:beta-lactamase family protein [Myxococcota bacterium]
MTPTPTSLPLSASPSLTLALALLASACSAEDRYQIALGHVGSAGAQLAVIESGGVTWSGATGLAGPEAETTGETAFLIGSNTKVVTAAAVLQLVEEGSLALDDPAHPWVPQLREEITVRHLLQHTSGLGEYFDHDAMTADDGAGLGQEWTPEELIQLGLEVRDDGPQSRGAYANTNFIALGRVVEAVDGRPYDVAVQARIFEPLGLDRCGVHTAGKPVPGHLAMGEGGDLGVVTRYHPSVGWAAGSAYATATQLARFYEAVFSAELYGEDLVAEQLDGNEADIGFTDEGMETAYGLGVMVIGMDGRTIQGHLGGVDGFIAIGVRDADTGAIAAVTSNSSHADVVGPALDALGVAGGR